MHFNVFLRHLLSFLPYITSSSTHLHKCHRLHFTVQLQLAHSVPTEYTSMTYSIMNNTKIFNEMTGGPKKVAESQTRGPKTDVIEVADKIRYSQYELYNVDNVRHE